MKNILLIATCLSLIFITSCKKDNTAKTTTTEPVVNNIISHQGQPTDGFGASNKPMTGTAFTFPAGITLNGTVKSSELGCSGMSFFDCPVNGTLTFYMSLRNTNSSPTTVILPAGLVIPSGDTLLQCAILTQADTVVVPAASYMCVRVNTYCVNETRTFNENAVYGNPMITKNTNYNAMMSLLATKKSVISENYVYNLQQAVWDIANQGQMTTADISFINSLP